MAWEQEVERKKKDYADAQKRGDRAGMDRAHKEANEIRDRAGVSDRFDRATGAEKKERPEKSWAEGAGLSVKKESPDSYSYTSKGGSKMTTGFAPDELYRTGAGMVHFNPALQQEARERGVNLYTATSSKPGASGRSEGYMLSTPEFNQRYAGWYGQEKASQNPTKGLNPYEFADVMSRGGSQGSIREAQGYRGQQVVQGAPSQAMPPLGDRPPVTMGIQPPGIRPDVRPPNGNTGIAGGLNRDEIMSALQAKKGQSDVANFNPMTDQFYKDASGTERFRALPKMQYLSGEKQAAIDTDYRNKAFQEQLAQQQWQNQFNQGQSDWERQMQGRQFDTQRALQMLLALGDIDTEEFTRLMGGWNPTQYGGQ